MAAAGAIHQQVPQDRETPLQAGRTAGFAWRYAYARAAETSAAGEPGQDYLAFRVDGATCTFALCDGVSQSFYGDLAARLLGDALLGWLEALPPDSSQPALTAALGQFLTWLVDPATTAVAERTLPRRLPPFVRDVLEEKRAHGSEAMFVCGRVDLPGPAVPDGRVVLARLGDSRLRLWDGASERTADLGRDPDTHERWSSRQGSVTGACHVFVAPAVDPGRPRLTRLLAYTDGLLPLDQHRQAPDDETVGALIARVTAAPTSDDLAFFDLRLLGPVAAQAVPLAMADTATDGDEGRLAPRATGGSPDAL